MEEVRVSTGMRKFRHFLGLNMVSLLIYIYSALAIFGSGLQAGFAPSVAFRNLQDPKIRKKIRQTVMLNGVLFLGSLFLWQITISPSISYFFSHFGPPGLFSSLDGNWSQTENKSYSISAIILWLTQLIYHLIWIWPLYGVSLLLNGKWYNSIAQRSLNLRLTHLRIRPMPQNSNRSVFIKISEELYRMVYGVVFLVHVWLITGLPLIGKIIGFVWLACFYSFYSFEYRWALLGWSFEKKLAYIRLNWLWMCGFGTPLALSTVWLPALIRDGVFAILFPLYIIQAIWVQSIPKSSNPKSSKPESKSSEIQSAEIQSSETKNPESKSSETKNPEIQNSEIRRTLPTWMDPFLLARIGTSILIQKILYPTYRILVKIIKSMGWLSRGIQKLLEKLQIRESKPGLKKPI